MDLKLPMINKKYAQWFSDECTIHAKTIKSRYGSILVKVASVVGVPVDLIVGFMLIEDPDLIPSAVSPANAVGLMQLQASTAYDTMANQAKDLKPAEASVIQKFLPSFLKVNGVQPLSAWKSKIFEALKNPEFNIWIGTICLGQLIKRTKDGDGNFRLDHVIVKYNAGEGNFHRYVVTGKLINADTATLVQKFPLLETKAYIVKFVGIDGSISQSIKVPMPDGIAYEDQAEEDASIAKVTFIPTSGLFGGPDSSFEDDMALGNIGDTTV